MNIKKILGWVLKLPLILLNLATLGVGIYAALGYIPGFLVSWAAPAIIGALQLAYLIGAVLINKSKADMIMTTDTEQYQSEEYVEQQ